MKRKPIRIDWDELESAFDNKHEHDLYYLDLITGEVVLEGEGEGDDSPDDDDMEEAMEGQAVAHEDPFHLYVEPPGPADEADWMQRFLEGSGDIPEDVTRELKAALESGDLDAFREVLRPHAEVRDAWFLFRSDCIHECIETWLETHRVQSTEPPPWR